MDRGIPTWPRRARPRECAKAGSARILRRIVIAANFIMRRKALDIDTLWQLQRVGQLAAAPDGARAVCTLTSYAMDENKSSTQLWLLSTTGAAPRQLTHSGEKNAQPAWSSDGAQIAFIAKREQQGKKDETAQLYVMDADGGEARRVSDFAPGIEAFKWMPDGRRIVFVAWVWPEVKSAAAQAKRFKEFAARKESGYATDQGQYRYFDHNLPAGRVPHLLSIDVTSGRVTDLFAATPYELPRDEPGAVHFDIRPDGRRIAFACDTQEPKRSSNRLAIVELDLKARRFTDITRSPDWDFNTPRYSPDGKTIAAVAAHSAKHHTALSQLANVPGVGEPVLGHFPEYKQLGDSLGARTFNIPEAVWSRMSESERWGANQRFLDRIISRGDDIILATPLDKVRPGSYFARELEYLGGKGYVPSADGSKLIKP